MIGGIATALIVWAGASIVADEVRPLKSINYYNAPEKAVEEWRKLKFGMHMQWDPVVLTGKEISWSRKGASALLHQGAGLDPEYDALWKKFNPSKYNALILCQTLKDAGMKFATFCNKHHDGFCMWVHLSRRNAGSIRCSMNNV